jgi:hypothetical protein|tara:strand:+ start:1701 stop:1922 length:222 start_codon:yes stop_codon:yes gene_type:complete
MTKSDQNDLNPLDIPQGTSIQDNSIQKLISQQADELFKVKAKKQDDFIFNQEVEDIDQLADDIFDALYDHTNK